MSVIRQTMQPLSCTIGFHEVPPPRNPPGPIVWTCPCCRRVIYCYGLSAYGLGAPPSLMIQNFPRVLNALPATS
ncbi:MAG: hypothetical protein RMJ43_11760 [Chloroherpetonaceae bacterium]|nr:hypothetical protein [Chthonomonadaceae bacterium]MDW8208504.1 hypothetical protein [Chloroherpetonaceae bacterium]